MQTGPRGGHSKRHTTPPEVQAGLYGCRAGRRHDSRPTSPAWRPAPKHRHYCRPTDIVQCAEHSNPSSYSVLLPLHCTAYRQSVALGTISTPTPPARSVDTCLSLAAPTPRLLHMGQSTPMLPSAQHLLIALLLRVLRASNHLATSIAQASPCLLASALPPFR